MKHNIIIAIIAITAVMLGLWGLTTGLERQERYECAKWAEQAKELKGFYYTSWQKAQCGIQDNKAEVSEDLLNISDLPELNFNWTPINDRTERPEPLPTIKFNRVSNENK
jgi:chloramphenicol O-acetyltransferase